MVALIPGSFSYIYLRLREHIFQISLFSKFDLWSVGSVTRSWISFSTIDFIPPGRPMASRAIDGCRRRKEHRTGNFSLFSPPSSSYLARYLSRNSREMFEHAPACSVVSFSVVHRYNVAKIHSSTIFAGVISVSRWIYVRAFDTSVYTYIHTYIYMRVYIENIYLCIYASRRI